MGILGNIIGNTVGSVISSGINAATGGGSKPSGGSSSSSSGSRPSGGGSSSGGSGSPPSDYQGGATHITVYDKNQQAIKDQMNANSAKWWAATSQAEKDALHKQNEQLAAMLGGNIQYTNGVWHGNADPGNWGGIGGGGIGGGGQGQNGQMNGYAPQDQSDYLNQLYAAQLEAQKAALKDSYEKNLSSLDAEQEKLGANYQSARNQTAAQSALSQQRFNETAAAYGLNTGTAGQAALSYSNQLQSDISSLQAAESAANAEIERQRTNLSKEYQSAMVQAQATNNYELFQALYQEAVRVDQALQQQSQFNSQQALQQYQMLLNKYNSDREWEMTQGQWDMTQQQWEYQQQQDQYKKDLAAAELLAAAGDYSAYGKLFGWDQAKIDQMNNAWKMANTITSSSGGGSGGGSSGGGGGGSSSGGSSSGSGGGYDALFQAAMQSGYPESYINNNYKNFGFSSKTGLYDDYLSWYEKNSSSASGQGMTQDQFDEVLRQIDFYFGNSMDETAMKIIQNNWDKISANPSMANQVKKKAEYFGYSIS